MSEPSDLTKQNAARPLHFVNTDAESITGRGTGKRIYDVKSHLSGHYRRWKKQQVLSAQPSQLRQQIFEEEFCASSSHQDELKGTMPTSAPDEPAPASELSSDESTRLEGRLQQQNISRAEESVLFLSALNHGNSDPFNVFPLPVDPRTNMYIQLFYQGTMISCCTHVAEQRLKTLVQHEALMHGVLAISKLIAAKYLPTPRGSADLLPASQRHYGELLRLMRVHILDPSQVDPDLAMEMMHAAMMFSFLAREYEEFELHLISFKSLVDSLGGLRAIHMIHSTRFMNAERLRGLFLLKKPLISVEGWVPSSWYEDDQLRPYDELYEQSKGMISSMESPLVPDGPFAEQVRDLIQGHRDMIAASNVIPILYPTRPAAINPVIRWSWFRYHALTIRTVEIVGEMMRARQSQPSIEISLQASACLAANFVAHLLHLSEKPIIGLSYVPFTTLIQMLREVAAGQQHGLMIQHQDIYLWALFVGACAELASRTWSCDRSFRGSSWCSETLAYMIERLGIDTFEELKDKLRQFLLPPMFESYMKVLFDKRHCLITLSTESLQLQLRLHD